MKDWTLKIFDDVLDDDDRIFLLDSFADDGTIGDVPFASHGLSIYWFANETNHPCKYLIDLLVSIATDYFDFSDYVGYEAWTHMNTRPGQNIDGYLSGGEVDLDSNMNKQGGQSSSHDGWHYDKDELYFNRTGDMKFPICSLVYYPLVAKDLKGGRLVFEDHKIIPKENRLVMFSPGEIHTVDGFKGKRCSLIINPWNTSHIPDTSRY